MKERPKTQQKAAKRLAAAFSKLFGATVSPDDIQLHPARGYWTHVHQDVQRFNGYVPRPDMPKLYYEFGSWDLTLSAIAAGRKFDIIDERNKSHAYNHFDITEKQPK